MAFHLLVCSSSQSKSSTHVLDALEELASETVSAIHATGFGPHFSGSASFLSHFVLTYLDNSTPKAWSKTQLWKVMSALVEDESVPIPKLVASVFKGNHEILEAMVRHLFPTPVRSPFEGKQSDC